MNISYYEIYENLHKEYLRKLCSMNTSIYENFELWSNLIYYNISISYIMRQVARALALGMAEDTPWSSSAAVLTMLSASMKHLRVLCVPRAFGLLPSHDQWCQPRHELTGHLLVLRTGHTRLESRDAYPNVGRVQCSCTTSEMNSTDPVWSVEGSMAGEVRGGCEREHRGRRRSSPPWAVWTCPNMHAESRGGVGCVVEGTRLALPSSTFAATYLGPRLDLHGASHTIAGVS